MSRFRIVGLMVSVLSMSFLLPKFGAAQTTTVLWNFSFDSNGSLPEAGLILDNSGNLYGTTANAGTYACGVVFKLSHGASGWNETVLYSFQGGSDGCIPSGIVMDTAGNIYGVTSSGGVYGLGVAFKLFPGAGGTWKESVIHAFDGKHGGEPTSFLPTTLVLDSTSSLYGVTTYGGTHTYGGTVYKLSPTSSGPWLHTVLYNFSGIDGQYASSRGLTLDASGNVYGVTDAGGTYGVGVVFKLSPSASGSWTETILYTFTGEKDGAYPNGGLIFDNAGDLYGTTSGGGGVANCYPGCGVIFKLAPTASGTWAETTLYSFASPEVPYANLVAGASGNLYGTSLNGGIYGNGAVFELSRSAAGRWARTTLHDFSYAVDGSNPYPGLVRDSSGNMYGTTWSGGLSYGGTIFEVSP